jgi:FtsH-binding integral membrane protein
VPTAGDHWSLYPALPADTTAEVAHTYCFTVASGREINYAVIHHRHDRSRKLFLITGVRLNGSGVMSIALGQPIARNTERLFFTGMALALALALFLGFLPSYFHRSAELPALTPLYQLHGALFTAWVALFVAQTALVAGHRTDIHRTLGVAGVVLAVVVVVLGVTVSVETLRRNGTVARIDPRELFAIALGDIIAFGALVSAAFVQRRRAETHKRLMLLATISLVTPAARRCVGIFMRSWSLNSFLGDDVFVPVLFFLATDVFVLVPHRTWPDLQRMKLLPGSLWSGPTR